MNIPSWDNPCDATHILWNGGHLGGTAKGGDPETWFPELWTWLIKEFDVKTVLDVGCGTGYAMKFFQDSGCEVEGIEGYDECVNNSVLKDKTILHDYTTGPYVCTKEYDLVYSSEFCEHIEEKFSDNFLVTFTAAKKILCVSPANPNCGGFHHVNSQFSDYWIKRIEPLGFEYKEMLTEYAKSLVPGGRLKRGTDPSLFQRHGMIFLKK